MTKPKTIKETVQKIIQKKTGAQPGKVRSLKKKRKEGK
jgi:hypothetical protein